MRSGRCGKALIFAMAWASVLVSAQAQPRFTPGKLLDFQPGTPKMAASFARVPDAQDLVTGRFVVATADLNDDGGSEVILQSADSEYCGSGGCLTVVLAIQPGGKKTAMLLSQNLDSSLAVTNEKVGAYRALASVMEDGKIQVGDKKGTPLHGRQMVYPMAVKAPPRF